jgi:hypothetical protein
MTPRSVELVPATSTDWPWWQSAVQMAWRCCRDCAGEHGRDAFWTPTPRMATRTSGAQPDSIAAARSFTLRTMQRWGAVDCGDDVAAVVSELLTNALRHALPQPTWAGHTASANKVIANTATARATANTADHETASHETAGHTASHSTACQAAADQVALDQTSAVMIGAAGPIRLGLLLPGPYVVCAVADPSAEAPVPRQPDWLEETGRGLQVVASLSHRWGYCVAPGEQGKVVWAAFRTAARPS